jgi:predicted ATP-dependent protease
VARIIEHSARVAGHQNKLSTQFGMVADLVNEAAYWHRKDSSDQPPQAIVPARAVQKAIDEMIYRENLLDERLQELIAENTLMIDVAGEKVGQINALSVLAVGDYAFGQPNRLTASVAPGRSGVIDIEREAKLGGPIHTKGVLILSGFLNHRYGSQGPLSLSASLTFEQSYSGVEGDSASAAELVVLLSAIAQVPIRQNLAITGSVNQLGQIQAVGGVNEKIEGFFTTCQAKGLTGDQGVVIPAANQRNLMLRAEVVEAVAAGKFHIYPIQTIDEGLTLMTGLPAGERGEDGAFPEGSLNQLVTDRLAEFEELLSKKVEEEQERPEEDELE